jgi:hypothetical protein
VRREKVTSAFHNVAAVATVALVVFRSQTYVLGSTIAATIYHVIVLIINDDLI